MAGDTAQADDAQKLWNEIAQEREAGEESPSSKTVATPEEQIEQPSTEQTQESKTTNSAQAQEQTDPFAGLSPEVRQRLEKLEHLEQQVAQLPQLIQHVKTAEGRVAAMQREIDSAKQAAKAVGNAGPTNAQIQAAQGDTKKWEALRADFPEWADATEQFVQASLAGLTSKQTDGLSPAQVEAMVNERLAGERAATARAIEEAKVEGKHGDWKAVINTPEFAAWYQQQSPELRALSGSERAADAIRLLDTYQAATAQTAAQQQQQRSTKLAAAVSARPGAAPVATQKTPDQMSPKEAWEYERKRAQRRNAGLAY